jgi:hypothetical protein
MPAILDTFPRGILEISLDSHPTFKNEQNGPKRKIKNEKLCKADFQKITQQQQMVVIPLCVSLLKKIISLVPQRAACVHDFDRE